MAGTQGIRSTRCPGTLGQGQTVSKGDQVPTVLTFDDVVPDLRRIVATLFSNDRAIRVLEAGCGSGTRADWLFQLKPGSQIVGIDISPEALEKNPVSTEKILGDIQTYPFPANEFDLIICYDVLEHLPRPGDALEVFARAVKPNGLIVLASPLLNSVKGLLTKMTPYRFHVLVCRYLFGLKDAGKPGHNPFPTYLRYRMSPRFLVRFAAEKNLSIEYLQPYSAGFWEVFIKNRALLAVGNFLGRLIEFVTRGKVSWENTEFVMILRKASSKF